MVAKIVHKSLNLNRPLQTYHKSETSSGTVLSDIENSDYEWESF